MDAKHICRNIANNLNFHTSIIVYINILNYDKYQKTRVNKSELIFPFAQFIITKLRYEYCSRLEKNKNLGALMNDDGTWQTYTFPLQSPPPPDGVQIQTSNRSFDRPFWFTSRGQILFPPPPPWTLCRKERGNGGKLEGGEQVVPLFKFRTRLGLPCLARIAYEK